MTNDKREQARVLPCPICGRTPNGYPQEGGFMYECSHAGDSEFLVLRQRWHSDEEMARTAWNDGAAALLREAEAATAPDVSDKELITLLHEAYSKRDTMLDRHLIEDELPRLITALRAARQREGELTQALADAKAERDRLQRELNFLTTEGEEKDGWCEHNRQYYESAVDGNGDSFDNCVMCERDTLRAENATLRAELAEGEKPAS